MSSDERMRRLEREAAQGDQDAALRLAREQNRGYGLRTIWHGVAEIGDVVAVWAGPNYADVGRLAEVYLDEIGRACAVLEDARILDDERETITWLGGEGFSTARIVIPSTSVTRICRAADRPGWAEAVRTGWPAA